MKKAEEAELDKDCEKGVIYDEDEDGEGVHFDNIEDDDDEDSQDEWDMGDETDEDDNPDLYETKLDKVDEILYVQEMLVKLEQANNSHYANILGLLSQEEQAGLSDFINQAQ